jgi:hypothetical protein
VRQQAAHENADDGAHSQDAEQDLTDRDGHPLKGESDRVLARHPVAPLLSCLLFGRLLLHVSIVGPGATPAHRSKVDGARPKVCLRLEW